MKRITTIIIVFFCTFLQMNAQIQRTFFGLELGKSTIQEVKDYCKSAKLVANVYKKKNLVCVYPWKNEISFGGVSWNEVLCSFNKGHLLTITFKKHEYIDYTKSESEMYLLFNDLKRRIDNKYQTYLFKEAKEETKDEWFYRDGNTLLQIILNKELQGDFEITYMNDMKPSDDEL